MRKVVYGNANLVEKKHRGWLVGWFVENPPELKQKAIEIKWRKHKKGESKQVSINNKAKTICVLISGHVEFYFPNQKQYISLTRRGDYVFWDGQTPHGWKILKDSLIMAVRWPSIPEDQVILA